MSPLVKNTSKYLPHYQRYRLKQVSSGWDSAGGIKSMYDTHSWTCGY